MNQDDDYSQVHCPHCGYEFELPYQPIEKQILREVASGERHQGKATTKSVAVRIRLSEDQTFRYLHKMEQEGKVLRVGTKGGWRTAA